MVTVVCVRVVTVIESEIQIASGYCALHSVQYGGLPKCPKFTCSVVTLLEAVGYC